MEPKIAMVYAYAHKITKMKRKDDGIWQEAWVMSKVIHPSLGLCYVGSFVQGVGLIHVHFQSADLRLVTKKEALYLTEIRYCRTYAPPFKLIMEDMATQADLDALPVKDYRNLD